MDTFCKENQFAMGNQNSDEKRQNFKEFLQSQEESSVQVPSIERAASFVKSRANLSKTSTEMINPTFNTTQTRKQLQNTQSSPLLNEFNQKSPESRRNSMPVMIKNESVFGTPTLQPKRPAERKTSIFGTASLKTGSPQANIQNIKDIQNVKKKKLFGGEGFVKSIPVVSVTKPMVQKGFKVSNPVKVQAKPKLGYKSVFEQPAPTPKAIQFQTPNGTNTTRSLFTVKAPESVRPSPQATLGPLKATPPTRITIDQTATSNPAANHSTPVTKPPNTGSPNQFSNSLKRSAPSPQHSSKKQGKIGFYNATKPTPVTKNIAPPTPVIKKSVSPIKKINGKHGEGTETKIAGVRAENEVLAKEFATLQKSTIAEDSSVRKRQHQVINFNGEEYRKGISGKIDQVVGVSKDPFGGDERLVYVKGKGGLGFIGNGIARRICPLELVEFYEKNLEFYG